jgi:hypothetical protein
MLAMNTPKKYNPKIPKSLERQKKKRNRNQLTDPAYLLLLCLTQFLEEAHKFLIVSQKFHHKKLFMSQMMKKNLNIEVKDLVNQLKAKVGV